MFGLNEYGLAIGLGVILFVLCVVVIIAESLWYSLFSFIDESEKPKHSKIITKLALSMGYTEREYISCFRFYDSEQELKGGFWPFMKHALILSLSPILILLAFKLYAITLFLVSATALLFLARFAFRAKKLMNKHIADKDAHKA